jgi:AraC family transcriptional activator of pobA
MSTTAEVSLVITGCSHVTPNGQGFNDEFASYDDSFLPSLRKLAAAAKRGAPAILQIFHGGSKALAALVLHNDIVSASTMDIGATAFTLTATSRTLTEAAIHGIIQNFGQATRRANEAGFDGVELHGAHGFLLQNFLSPFFNQRTDQWSGSLETACAPLWPFLYFYRMSPNLSPLLDLKLKGFKVYEKNFTLQPAAQLRLAAQVFSRRDYYKVLLLESKCLLHYGHQSLELDGPYLFFTNPHVPYSLELRTDQLHAYTCLFTEEFVRAADRSASLHQSPLFRFGSPPLLKLPASQADYVRSIFQKMLTEQQGDYAFKGDLIRTYVQLLIHEALHLQPAETVEQPKNAATRLTTRFLELLEGQFPIEVPAQQLALNTPQDFADRLAVQVNHLNKAVKQVTGKPTSAHITGRILDEAKALLQHTDWSVASIGACLGFEYPTYFQNFFKKHTDVTPLSLRRQV